MTFFDVLNEWIEFGVVQMRYLLCSLDGFEVLHADFMEFNWLFIFQLLRGCEVEPSIDLCLILGSVHEESISALLFGSLNERLAHVPHVFKQHYMLFVRSVQIQVRWRGRAFDIRGRRLLVVKNWRRLQLVVHRRTRHQLFSVYIWLQTG